MGKSFLRRAFDGMQQRHEIGAHDGEIPQYMQHDAALRSAVAALPLRVVGDPDQGARKVRDSHWPGKKDLWRIAVVDDAFCKLNHVGFSLAFRPSVSPWEKLPHFGIFQSEIAEYA